MKIKAENKFMCIKDVVMLDSGKIAYYANKVYKSDRDGCITDEQGNKSHYWIKSDKPGNYFKPYAEKLNEELNEELKDQAQRRYEYNKKILEALKEAIDKRPYYRFGQLIQNLGIVDRGDCFYIESEESYKNMKQCMEKENY